MKHRVDVGQDHSLRTTKNFRPCKTNCYHLAINYWHYVTTAVKSCIETAQPAISRQLFQFA